MPTGALSAINSVLETCLYVDDLAAAERFYTQVLGLTLVSRQEGRHVFLRCGQQMVLLFDPLEASKTSDNFPPHGATGAGHVCFSMQEAQLPQWANHLQQNGIAIEKTIDWPGGGRSIYFRDPAGNSLELGTPRIWGIEEPPK